MANSTARIEVYFGLGSNLGDRDINLLRAMNMMDEAFGTHPERISRIVETPAWGFDGPPFLNMCVMYRLVAGESARSHALEILDRVKEIERALGRTEELQFDAGGRRIYHNRIIDIDILCYGGERINCDTLTVPHPLIGQRDFVKIPLREISKPALRSAFPELFD